MPPQVLHEACCPRWHQAITESKLWETWGSFNSLVIPCPYRNIWLPYVIELCNSAFLATEKCHLRTEIRSKPPIRQLPPLTQSFWITEFSRRRRSQYRNRQIRRYQRTTFHTAARPLDKLPQLESSCAEIVGVKDTHLLCPASLYWEHTNSLAADSEIWLVLAQTKKGSQCDETLSGMRLDLVRNTVRKLFSLHKRINTREPILRWPLVGPKFIFIACWLRETSQP